MSVELDPAELGFRRPFTREVTEALHLRNRNTTPVAFKVKTTAPKQYCVRPNSGRIEPGQHVEIQVLLQAMKEEPPMDARCRDKFLVQSTAITPELESENISSIWSAVEKSSRESIKERKIRVTFLPPGDATVALNGAAAAHDDQPPAYSAPEGEFGSPKQDAREFNTPHKGGAAGDESTGSLLTNPGAAASAAGSAISSAAETTKETLQQQLDSAKVTIAQLRSQADEGGLRQRKVGVTDKDEKSGAVLAQKPAEAAHGVPVAVVAALCLLSFLLAYFLF